MRKQSVGEKLFRFENVMAGVFCKRLTYGELTGATLPH